MNTHLDDHVLLSKIFEVICVLQRATPDVSLSSLYNALLQGMCLQGQSDKAKKLYMRMHNSGFKPDGKTRALMLQQLTRDSVRHRVRYCSHLCH